MVEVAVGRVVKAHGIRGEVSVHLLTDDPARRFRAGSRLSGAGQLLTLTTVRHHQNRLLVTFEEVHDRTQAEALAGTVLTLEVDSEEDAGEDDAWFDHQLEGLAVRLPTGEQIGTVARVEHGAAQDLLVITRDGREALVPFVTALVPTVDPEAGFLVVDPPGGLLDDLDPTPGT